MNIHAEFGRDSFLNKKNMQSRKSINIKTRHILQLHHISHRNTPSSTQGNIIIKKV